jgi:hypothetical protein
MKEKDRRSLWQSRKLSRDLFLKEYVNEEGNCAGSRSAAIVDNYVKKWQHQYPK